MPLCTEEKKQMRKQATKVVTSRNNGTTAIMVRARPQHMRIYHECEGRIEKSVQRIAVWHHEAFHVMTYGDPKDPSITQIMDSFSCSSLNTTFCLKKAPRST